MAFAIIWFVALAAVFFVLIVRPQRRRSQAQRALLAALAPGDDVVTTGGIYGRIQTLESDVVLLEVADGVVVKAARAAIIGRLSTEAAAGEAA
jgi:preprotein translocase subunit YajC